MSSMNELVEQTREKFTNIANAIRSVTGSDEALSVDEMPTVIEELSTGSSVEGGFTVNFHDENGVLVSSNSAGLGELVYAPESFGSQYFLNEDGMMYTSPITSNVSGEVINLYSNDPPFCSEQLYKHFNVDPEVYPYIVVWYYQSVVYIVFATNIINGYLNAGSYNIYIPANCDYLKGSIGQDSIGTAVGTTYNITITITDANLQLYNHTYLSSLTTNNYGFYCNFKPHDSVRTFCGRLDETLYEPDGETHPYLLQTKTITANGEVTPDEGYYGLSKVTVDVETGIVMENSFTVNFHDADGVWQEAHITKVGNQINEPVNHNADYWQDENGNIKRLPLSSEESGILYNLYPIVIGENGVRIVDPSGTDFDTTFLQTDGTAQSGYTGLDYGAYGGIKFNNNENEWKLEIGESNSHNSGVVFKSPIVCSDYKYLKIKYLYYTDGYSYYTFMVNLAKDTAQGNSGHTANNYKSVQLANKNYTQNYYMSLTGDSSWNYAEAIVDLDNPAWMWAVIDISDWDEFYLSFQGWGYNNYIADVILTKE